MTNLHIGWKWITMWIFENMRMTLFQMLKFGLEIFQILQKCCSNTNFFQGTTFYHLVKVYFKT